MRAYGLPRLPELICPDVGDAALYGCPGRATRNDGGSTQTPVQKAAARRRLARVARREGRQECSETD